jgi:hypothetical protein
VKIPVEAGAIDRIAEITTAAKTEAVVALLNEGLRRAAARMGRVQP